MAEGQGWEPLTGWVWTASVGKVAYGREASGEAWLRLELFGRAWTVALGRELALCRPGRAGAGDPAHAEEEERRCGP